ncbi:hypothetical protein M3212_08750 [Alkalihalobacillus oceani]|uniref:hypothetical protein n=1 Tax=Halalkalibacter oceani TaxID=1653776 RepID=UPI002041AFDA|nr:hypothetical protein [Halalkalibacter oceani]MCM3760877.1 hypothetical protein [Halalkalibacter oceani]
MRDTCPIPKLTNYSASVTRGIHTLYVFCEMEKYIDNVNQFIYKGIQQNAVILVIETKEVIANLKKRVASSGLTEKQLSQINFKENLTFTSVA